MDGESVREDSMAGVLVREDSMAGVSVREDSSDDSETEVMKSKPQKSIHKAITEATTEFDSTRY